MNEEATKVLTVVCEKMGIGAEMVWGAYMKQAAIWGWASIAVFITLVLFTAVVLSKLIKSLKKGRDKDTTIFDCLIEKESAASVIVMLFCALLIFILALLAITCFGDVLAAFFNPEYWAADDIISSLRQVRN